jgi:hypothetical protein
MPPPPTRLDPDGYYARLGVEPAAPHASIVTAYRAKARVLHPDVPHTGNAAAFVAVKQAYDVLSDRDQRQAYDRKARELAERPSLEPEVAAAVHRTGYRPTPYNPTPYRPTSHGPTRGPAQSAPQPPSHPARPWSAFLPSESAIRRVRLSGMSMWVWGGLAAFLCLCLYEAASHVLTPPAAHNAGIRPNAQSVEPLSPAAHRAVLYGPAPVKLPGTSNFYVVPAGTPAVLWRLDTERNTLVAWNQLPPFSAVQGIRLVRQTGMVEVLVNDKSNGFVSADHLTPGNAAAARAAYCGYNSGPTPNDAEELERHANGNNALEVENRTVQPAVVKLRDQAGAVAVAVFLNPGSHADIDRLPEGTFHPEFAIGELWSRACNAFAAGMRARRMNDPITLPGTALISVAPDSAAASDISDQAFAKE